MRKLRKSLSPFVEMRRDLSELSRLYLFKPILFTFSLFCPKLGPIITRTVSSVDPPLVTYSRTKLIRYKVHKSPRHSRNPIQVLYLTFAPLRLLIRLIIPTNSSLIPHVLFETDLPGNTGITTLLHNQAIFKTLVNV